MSPEVIVKGFENCCISNAMDGTDDMLWNDSESVRKMRALTVKLDSDSDW
jgi:hypothetical protein